MNPSTNGWSLDDFFIIAELFRSENGTVYKARFKNNRDKIVVLKERKCAELGGDGDIMNEVLLLEKLDHPNIIGCEGHFWDYSTRTLFIVLEYADDGDLYHALLHRKKQGKRLREGDIWNIFMQACAGLKYLHDQRIVHRDIKSLVRLFCPCYESLNSNVLP